jgi:hypothetical protein
MAAVAFLSLAIAVSLAGCGAQISGEASATRLTDAQRDSAIARGEFAGSATVDRALQLAGKQAARAGGLDSLPK